MTNVLYLPLFHYLQAPAEQDYPDLRWQSLPGPEREQWTSTITRCIYFILLRISKALARLLFFCVAVSYLWEADLHVISWFHPILGCLHPLQTRKGTLGTNMKIPAGRKSIFLWAQIWQLQCGKICLFSPPKKCMQALSYFLLLEYKRNCVIWHTGNYTRDINSKWDM